MSEIAALIERVEKLTGPDREVDYDIWANVDPPGVENVSRTEGLRMSWGQWREYHWSDRPSSTDGRPDNHQAYTASIDAAVALVARVLPGACYRVEKSPPPLAREQPYWASAGLPGEQELAEAATPALALVLALLRATQARQEEGADGVRR